MLEGNSLKVHAKILLFIAHEDRFEGTSTLSEMNSMFILGILDLEEFRKNSKEQQNTLITRQYRKLSLYVAPDKLRGRAKSGAMQEAAEEVAQIINQYKGLKSDAERKIFDTFRGRDELEAIVSTLIKEYTHIPKEQLLAAVQSVKQNPIASCKFVTNSLVIKLLLIIFFPLVVALLTAALITVCVLSVAALIIACALSAAICLFIAPFVNMKSLKSKYSRMNLNSKYSHEETGTEDVEDENCGTAFMLALYEVPIFSIIVLLSLFPSIALATPIISILLVITVIHVLHTSSKIIKPFLAVEQENGENIKLVNELATSDKWKSFKEGVGWSSNGITDEQINQYLQEITSAKSQKPSSRVEGVSDNDQLKRHPRPFDGVNLSVQNLKNQAIEWKE